MSVPVALAKLRANKPITAAEADEIVGSLGGAQASPFQPAHTLALTGGGGGSDGGTSFWGGLKDLGSGALKTLATPGNALVTTLGNAGLALAGRPTIPWSDMLGAWHGRSPGTDVLEHAGVGKGLARTLGGLGLDIGVDPLWALGIGKLPKTIADVAEAGRGVEGSITSERAAQGLGRVFPEALPTVVRKAAVRAQHDVHVPHGAHMTLGKLGRLSQRGRLVDHDLFVFRANKNNANPLFKIAHLADPAHFRTTDHVLPYEFKSAASAEHGAHAIAQATQDAHRAGSLLEGGIVTPNLTREALGQQRVRLAHEAAAPKEYAVRLGLGRLGKTTPLSRTFRTGITARARPLSFAGKTSSEIGKLLNTRFVKHPVARIARGLERSTRDVQAGIAVQTKNLAKQLGLDAQDARRLGVYLGVRNEGQAAGDLLRRHMIDVGMWKPEYDKAIDVFDTHLGRMAEDVGMYTKKDVPRLRQEIDKHIDAGEDAEAVHKAQIVARLEGKPYFPRARSSEVNARLREAVQESQMIGDPRVGGYLPGANPFVERNLPHPFAAMSHDDVVAQLKTELGLSDTEADTMSHVIQAGLERSTGTGFAGATHAYDLGKELVNYKPNLNAFDLFSRRATMQVQKQLDDEVVSLLKEAGLETPQDISQARELIMRMTNTKNIPGTLRSSGKAFDKFEAATQFLKKAFTIWLPAHFVRNALGDFKNVMVQGGLQHLAAGPEIGIGQWAGLVRGERAGDAALLAKEIKIGNRVYRGDELLTIARMSGAGIGTRLSHGFVGEDIKAATDLLEDAVRTRNPLKRYSGFMRQLNVDRENAQRLRTWALHMDRGDDMFTAAAKTLRTSFDYGDLTNFERVWMRNLVLFYTWFRKNTMLHVGGMATRPGLYAAQGQTEAAREKFMNEPGYYSMLGLLPTVAGNVAYGDPVADALNKLNLTEAGIRQSTIGQLTPFLQIPVGLATGTNPVTGQAFATHPVSSPLFGRIPGLGTTASAFSRGPTGPAIDSRIAYILGSVSPGPISAGNAVLQPGYEGSTALDLLGRLSGVRVMQNAPARFAAIANIKTRAAAKQAASLKRYNVS